MGRYSVKSVILSVYLSVIFAISSVYFAFIIESKVRGYVYEPRYIALKSNNFYTKNMRYLTYHNRLSKQTKANNLFIEHSSNERILANSKDITYPKSYIYANGPESMFLYQRTSEIPYACLCAEDPTETVSKLTEPKKSNILCQNINVQTLRKNSHCYAAKHE